MPADEIRASVRAAMPTVIDDLGKLVGHASCAFPGFPAEPVHAARAEVIRIMKDAGLANAAELDLEGGGYPAVWGDIPGPEGAPTVLLYAHYDVQPAPMEQGWTTDPFVFTKKDDGRYYGRGAADDKSGVAIHAGTLMAFDGAPPVGVKVIIEGEEETMSHLEAYVGAHPERFKADVIIVADMGNIECGIPVLTTMLRGHVQCTVQVDTIDHPLHSGVFGGPAPDALMALIRILASLQDDAGNPAVAGAMQFDWPGADYPEPLYRQMAAMLPGVDVIGDDSIATKLWSKPVISVIGIDAPSVAEAGNVLIPSARAKVAMRIAPGADPRHELDLLEAHLRAAAPWNVKIDVQDVKASDAFKAPTGGPGMAAAQSALAEAYGTDVSQVGSGGSIPLLETLMKASPGAEFILWGAEDAPANIHGANESVHPDEIERMIVAQVLLMERLAEG
ncbi:MAG: M20/M25/M40 family metallo-hydrolase [Coriobacteriia bacterium]|nr:M20/M25/M40 family metallo-hydrolase [Coriobacteriia bacterium]